ncbi:hypothetical protein [Argonema galeatum]|uniref:hypothetical protein n=1 Tax=Argonema galeatum TaxID=2942762 RepID=UPI00201328C0|nr:hypothetical protein [Argonema galeatum]MCL1464714.1 hypothetical protein [Argonema galeatum A003/A1]
MLFFLSQLKLANLTDEQKGDILAELTGVVCHLHVHTENLPDLIGDKVVEELNQGDDSHYVKVKGARCDRILPRSC